ncbi:hypothetical protein C8Q80DRAFT_1216108 [Daedaleopsis nitida]|nr:hypothetical protein C8Q80DRAFT_1216108 [Daedaleopsis nitida]
MVNTCSPLIEETDSKTVMDSVTKQGYILQKNPPLTKSIIAAMRSHNGHYGNEMADMLAGEGTDKQEEPNIDLRSVPSLCITGCELSSMSQKLAYWAIRNKPDVNLPVRRRTAANVAMDDTIWKSLRSKHVLRECSQFLWMTLHDGYMIGDKWMRPKMSDELQARALCQRCGDIKNMNHILFECRCVGQGTIWELLEEVWALTNYHPVDVNWGTTVGAACASFKSETGVVQPQANALWTILALESTHLAWKLCCERVIQNDGEEATIPEVTNRWYAAISRRLELDRRSSAKHLGPCALNADMTARIWEPTPPEDCLGRG